MIKELTSREILFIYLLKQEELYLFGCKNDIEFLKFGSSILPFHCLYTPTLHKHIE